MLLKVCGILWIVLKPEIASLVLVIILDDYVHASTEQCSQVTLAATNEDGHHQAKCLVDKRLIPLGVRYPWIIGHLAEGPLT